MTDEQVENFAEMLRQALVGKPLKVPERYYYTDHDEEAVIHGEVVVKLCTLAGADDDLHAWWSNGHYTPRWWADVAGDERRFWCCPVSFERATDKWSFHFEEVKAVAELKEYRVVMSGMADMRGVTYLKATNEEAARQLALQYAGEVDWRYNGMDYETVDVEAVT